MTKGLEALGKLTGTQNLTMYEQNECLKIIEKELKAFEIIKELKINLVIFIGSDSVEEYSKHPLTYRKLTQEQFDLIKEVLKNG